MYFSIINFKSRSKRSKNIQELNLHHNKDTYEELVNIYMHASFINALDPIWPRIVKQLKPQTAAVPTPATIVIKGEDPEEDSDQGSGGHDNGGHNGTNNRPHNHASKEKGCRGYNQHIHARYSVTITLQNDEQNQCFVNINLSIYPAIPLHISCFSIKD